MKKNRRDTILEIFLSKSDEIVLKPQVTTEEGGKGFDEPVQLQTFHSSPTLLKTSEVVPFLTSSSQFRKSETNLILKNPAHTRQFSLGSIHSYPSSNNNSPTSTSSLNVQDLDSRLWRIRSEVEMIKQSLKGKNQGYQQNSKVI